MFAALVINVLGVFYYCYGLIKDEDELFEDYDNCLLKPIKNEDFIFCWFAFPEIFYKGEWALSYPFENVVELVGS